MVPQDQKIKEGEKIVSYPEVSGPIVVKILYFFFKKVKIEAESGNMETKHKSMIRSK